MTVCYEYLADILKNALEGTLPSVITQDDAILGPFMDVFLHETGHAVFDQLNVPVLGREEDAVLGPLLVFAPQLAQAKRMGLREYGTLAEHYVRKFDAKWLRGGASADEPFVGSADIQSLADLSNSFEVVRTMRIVPFTKETIIQLAAATVVPIAPLLLTMMSLEDILNS